MSDVGTAIPESLAALIRELEPIAPDERRHLLRGDAALMVDGLFVRVARGQGAIDVEIGRGLAALSVGNRMWRLGFARLGDFARERLGLAASTANAMALLARELERRPLLAEAVRKGEVSARKAREVLPLALGEKEREWVERARSETVRALKAAVGAAKSVEDPEEEVFERILISLEKGQREEVMRAFTVARRVLGATASNWECLRALCQETLGAAPVEEREEEDPRILRGVIEYRVNQVKKDLEVETRRWAVLEEVPWVEAAGTELWSDPFWLDEHLRKLIALRKGWDEAVGRLALHAKMLGLWRDMGFATFEHYCSERLGMSVRAVEQRIALERKFYDLPSLRQALKDGRVSYEKARLISLHARGSNVDAWIARAEASTSIELRRALEAEEEAQMCSRPWVELVVPQSVIGLFGAACRAVQEAEGKRLSPGDCLVWMAKHFLAVWEPALPKSKTPQQKVRERDKGLCQVPGCSHPADDSHHIETRARGGGNALKNQVSLCKVHHLHGVHAGYIYVEGEAPDALYWELGVRPGRPPLIVVRPKGAEPARAAA